MINIKDQLVELYTEFGDFYAHIEHTLARNALGYEILYGPPVTNAPVVFMGYQPGGRENKRPQNMHSCPDTHPWPSYFEYVTAEYRLAKRLRLAFGAQFLSQCTGLNAIFLRSPNKYTYEKNVSAEVRKEVLLVCLRMVQQVISLLQPRIVVALGFESLEFFTGRISMHDLADSRGNALLISGSFPDGTKAVAIRHPTGSRPPPTDEDLREATRCILQRIGDKS